jgi:succinyl-diaminopimelate desuccinylase
MTQDQLIQKAKQLIAIPSTADNQPALHKAVDVIANIIGQYEGITVERFESNGVPSLLAYADTKRPDVFDVLLNGHVDVVPAKPEVFIPRLEDGKLYGRGVYDMKMACLIMADVFCRIATSGPNKIGLQIVADEEVGGYNGAAYQLQQGVNANFVLAGEMTDLGICNETRGLCWVELEFTGYKAHGGYVWDGSNALTKASDFAQAVLKKFPVPHKKTWTTTANIASITTDNKAFNQVPDYATLQIDFRFTPENPIFENEESVSTFLKSIDPNATIVAFPIFEPAVAVAPNDPHLQHLMAAYKQATGDEPKLIKRYASSDARHFATYNTPCIEFGLAGKDLHADNEYVDIASIIPFQKTLERFLYDYTHPSTTTRRHANSDRAAITQ